MGTGLHLSARQIHSAIYLKHFTAPKIFTWNKRSLERTIKPKYIICFYVAIDLRKISINPVKEVGDFEIITITINFVFKEAGIMFQFFVWENILIIKLTNSMSIKNYSIFTARKTICINDLEEWFIWFFLTSRDIEHCHVYLIRLFYFVYKDWISKEIGTI